MDIGHEMDIGISFQNVVLQESVLELTNCSSQNDTKYDFKDCGSVQGLVFSYSYFTGYTWWTLKGCGMYLAPYTLCNLRARPLNRIKYHLTALL